MESRVILYNFASRSRPRRFQQTMDNIARMSAGSAHIFAVKLDHDDPLLTRYPDYRSAFIGHSVSKVHAINRDIPTTGWDILVNISDDIRFTARGFDNIIRQHCGPDDFVLFPEPFASRKENTVEGIISVMSVIGRAYYERDGYVYHPSYKRTHCDDEATNVAKIRGRYKEVMEDIFYHEHPHAGYKVNDPLYRLQRKTWAADAENYRQRRERGFQ